MNTPAADTTAPTSSAAPAAPDFGAISSVAEYESVRESVLHTRPDADAGEAAPIEAPPAQPEQAQADPADTEQAGEQDAAEPQERDEQGKFKPKKSAQRRIDQAIYEREEARREAAALREEIARFRAQQAPPATATAPASQPQATAQPPAEQADPQPDATDLAKYPDGPWDPRFQADMARWGARQEVRAFQQEQQRLAQQQAAQHSAQSRMRVFAERLDAGAQADPTFIQALSPEVQNLRPAMSLAPNEQPTGATAMADALLESEQPARLARYLSEHPDDFRRLAALHPMLAMREIGRIEARLDAAPASGSASAAPSVSQAKPPIQPVGRSVSSAASRRDPSRISSVAEWMSVRDSIDATR